MSIAFCQYSQRIFVLAYSQQVTVSVNPVLENFRQNVLKEIFAKFSTNLK